MHRHQPSAAQKSSRQLTVLRISLLMSVYLLAAEILVYIPTFEHRVSLSAASPVPPQGFALVATQVMVSVPGRAMLCCAVPYRTQGLRRAQPSNCRKLQPSTRAAAVEMRRLLTERARGQPHAAAEPCRGAAAVSCRCRQHPKGLKLPNAAAQRRPPRA